MEWQVLPDCAHADFTTVQQVLALNGPWLELVKVGNADKVTTNYPFNIHSATCLAGLFCANNRHSQNTEPPVVN